MPDVFHGAEALQRAAALKLVHTDPSGWIREYLDERTGQVWVLDPNGEMHGGGPP